MLMKMDAARWTFLFTLCFTCVSSNESCDDLEHCEVVRLRRSLGSSLFLPCYVKTSSSKWVTWSHSATGEVVQLSSEGHGVFLDPRNGRVKIFPNQGSEGNFSIRIDELKVSDLGCYRCGWNCFQVADEKSSSGGILSLIHICARVAALLLLSVGGFCCFKICRSLPNNKTEDTGNSPTHAGTEGAER